MLKKGVAIRTPRVSVTSHIRIRTRTCIRIRTGTCIRIRTRNLGACNLGADSWSFSQRNPNEGQRVDKVWIPYVPRKAYFKFNSNLSKKNFKNEEDDVEESEQISFDIRNDVYDFWTNKIQRSGSCETYDSKTNPYVSEKHSRGQAPAVDACLGRLAEHDEYMNIKNNFLILYEKCVGDHENNAIYRNMFVTFCLDILVVRRMLIEYKTCCLDNDERITSTICHFKNFDKKLLDLNVDDLIEFAKNSTTMFSPTPPAATQQHDARPPAQILKSTASASIMNAGGSFHALTLFFVNTLVILLVYLTR